MAHFLYVAALLTLFLSAVFGRCVNWCSQRGECTAEGEDGYCICHHGFTGDDCMTRICPKAYEPHSVEERPARRTFRVTTGVLSGALRGSYTLRVGEDSVKFGADANEFTASKCNEALDKLLSIGSASCKLDTVDLESGAGSYTIVIQDYPLVARENNLFSHSGNLPSSAITCNMSAVYEASSPTCEVEDIVGGDANLDADVDGNSMATLASIGLPLYAECSDHGACGEDGTCKCQAGYYGTACNSFLDNNDVDTVISSGPFFTGTVLRVEAERTPTREFNLFAATLGRNPDNVVSASGSRISTGDITVIRGDATFIHNGDHVVNGAATISTCSDGPCSPLDISSSSSTLTLAQLQSVPGEVGSVLTSFTDGKDNFHIKAFNTGSTENEMKEVFSIGANGELAAASGSFVANEGLISSTNMEIAGSLDVSGPVTLADSLTLGSEFTLTPGGMTVSVDRHTGTLLDLRSGQEGFDGSLLELHSVGNTSSMMRAIVDGVKTFEVQSNGDMFCQSLVMHTGGVDVRAGGINVASGGLNVESGGLSVLSGEVNIAGTDLRVASLKPVSDAPTGSIVHAKAENAEFSGTFFTMEATSEKSTDFEFLEALGPDGSKLLRIDANGKLHTKGGVSLTGSASLSVEGPATFMKNLRMQPVHIFAGETISVPPHVGFVIIDDDAAIAQNAIQFRDTSEIGSGSVLAIKNNDAEATSSPFIPSGATAMFVFDGVSFQEVSSSKSSQLEFDGVKSLNVANDIDMGEHTISMGTVAVGNMKEGQVPVIGASGVMAGFPNLLFKKGILNVPALKMEKLLSDIDARGHAITNAELIGAGVSNSSISATSLTLPSLAGATVRFAVIDENGALMARDDIQNLVFSQGQNIPEATFEKIASTSARLEDVAIKSLTATEVVVDTATVMTLKANSVDTDHATITSLTTTTTEAETAAIETLKVTTVSADEATVTALKATTASVDEATINKTLKTRTAEAETATVKTLHATTTTADTATVKTFTTTTAEAETATVKTLQATSATFDEATTKTVKATSATIEEATMKSVAATSIEVDSVSVATFLKVASLAHNQEGGYADLAVTTDGKIVINSEHRRLGDKGADTELEGLKVTGSTGLEQDLSVSGDLRVSKAAHLASLTVSEGMKVSGNSDLEGAMSISKNLKVSGTAEVGAIRADKYIVAGESITAASVATGSLAPIDATEPLQVKDAALENVTYKSGSITGGVAIQGASELTVDGVSSLNGDTHVGGTLQVHGTVMGTGPYIDSSDKRFKRNIEPVDNALSLIGNLTAYRYYYRTDEFPEKKFPEELQVGWIAQEVDECIPELVGRDDDGFNHVAYARATAIVATAVNELRQEVVQLREELTHLRATTRRDSNMQQLREELLELVAGLHADNEDMKRRLTSVEK